MECHLSHTFRVSSVSSAAPLPSQCLKYSSTAAFCAALSFWSMADMPPRVADDLPCMALLNSASREWSSFSSAIGDIFNLEWITVLAGYIETGQRVQCQLISGNPQQRQRGQTYVKER
jgi:hypothetical protein